MVQESGLIDWLRQQQLLTGNGRVAAQHSQGRIAAEQLPPNLRAVLQKARQVLVDWQQAQQQQQQQQQAGGERAAAAGGDSKEERTQEEGFALVNDLLARLAIETEAGGAAEGSSQASAQPGDAANQPCEAELEGEPSSSSPQPQQQRTDPGALTISTIHAAKGLEWRVVLIPFANEGHLPLAWRPPSALLAYWQAGGGCERDVAEMRRAHYEEER